VIADSGGRIVLVNAQTETLFGSGRDEPLGQPVEMLLPESGETGTSGIAWAILARDRWKAGSRALTAIPVSATGTLRAGDLGLKARHHPDRMMPAGSTWLTLGWCQERSRT
jgi:PAS domain-containing protein